MFIALLMLLGSFSVVIESIEDFAIRLNNSYSNNSNEGRLEIYYSGIWGTVCDDSFTDVSARVACASLGYGYFGREIGNRYGRGTGQIWLDDVRCIGTEIGIHRCPHSAWGVHDCDHTEDVSISCVSTARTTPTTTTYYRHVSTTKATQTTSTYSRPVSTTTATTTTTTNYRPVSTTETTLITSTHGPVPEDCTHSVNKPAIILGVLFGAAFLIIIIILAILLIRERRQQKSNTSYASQLDKQDLQQRENSIRYETGIGNPVGNVEEGYEKPDDTHRPLPTLPPIYQELNN